MRTSAVAKALRERVERTNVIAVSVGQGDTSDRAAGLRGCGDESVRATAHGGVDEGEAVVLPDEEGVHETETRQLRQVGCYGCGLQVVSIRAAYAY
jgi:hypothetical protein